jgi:hypothetical protein
MKLSFFSLARAFLFSSTLIALSVDGAFALQASVQWADTATSESGFKVERKVSPTGTYSQIALTAANIVSFVDPNLSASTTYCYRVRAYNTDGNSEYTNEMCGTTR